MEKKEVWDALRRVVDGGAQLGDITALKDLINNYFEMKEDVRDIAGRGLNTCKGTQVEFYFTHILKATED